MAIDTTTKKLSLINFGSPWVSSLPEPDGSLATADLQHLLGLYGGIAVGAPVVTRTAPVVVAALGVYAAGPVALQGAGT